MMYAEGVSSGKCRCRRRTKSGFKDSETLDRGCCQLKMLEVLGVDRRQGHGHERLIQDRETTHHFQASREVFAGPDVVTVE